VRQKAVGPSSLTSFVDIDTPLQAAGASSAAAGPEPSPDQISMIADMGFSAAQARRALRETVSSVFASPLIPSRLAMRSGLSNGCFPIPSIWAKILRPSRRPRPLNLISAAHPLFLPTTA